MNLGEYIEREKQNEIIHKTENPEVNQVLEGGFKGGYIYKIIGTTLTGKTSLVNSLVQANLYKKNIKILFFSFIYDNIDSDILENIESNENTTLEIEEEIHSFEQLLLSDYFKNKGEKLKKYNIVIFDPFTIILTKYMERDNSILSIFMDILNTLAWRNKICFIFTIYAKKLGNTFWYYENDKKEVERLILRNYEIWDALPQIPNLINIYLYKMQKYQVVKYYMKVCSSCLNRTKNMIEWDMNN